MSKSKGTSTALVVQDVNVSQQIGLITQKIAEMKAIETSKWQTSGKLTMVGGVMDIRTETSQEKLVKGLANVVMQVDALEKSYKLLGLEKYPVPQVDGASLADWVTDITLRLKVINQKEELDALETIKREWVELMDKDDKKQLLLKKMQQFTGTIEE